MKDAIIIVIISCIGIFGLYELYKYEQKNETSSDAIYSTFTDEYNSTQRIYCDKNNILIKQYVLPGFRTVFTEEIRNDFGELERCIKDKS